MNAVCKMSKEPTTWPCSCRHCPLFFDCLTEYEQAVKKPMTHADRIRAMSDEELAETLFELYRLTMEQDGGDIARHWCDGKSGCIDEHGEVECNEERHKACILRWLQQPAEEVHHE